MKREILNLFYVMKKKKKTQLTFVARVWNNRWRDTLQSMDVHSTFPIVHSHFLMGSLKFTISSSALIEFLHHNWLLDVHLWGPHRTNSASVAFSSQSDSCHFVTRPAGQGISACGARITKGKWKGQQITLHRAPGCAGKVLPCSIGNLDSLERLVTQKNVNLIQMTESHRKLICLTWK